MTTESDPTALHAALCTHAEGLTTAQAEQRLKHMASTSPSACIGDHCWCASWPSLEARSR